MGIIGSLRHENTTSERREHQAELGADSSIIRAEAFTPPAYGQADGAAVRGPTRMAGSKVHPVNAPRGVSDV
jgi:hypothetical protein